MAALSEEDEDQNLMQSAVVLVGTEDKSDDDENYKREREKYIDALESWRESSLEWVMDQQQLEKRWMVMEGMPKRTSM
jgi:hypothetical protein